MFHSLAYVVVRLSLIHSKIAISRRQQELLHLEVHESVSLARSFLHDAVHLLVS
jgi:hypothetical protein